MLNIEHYLFIETSCNSFDVRTNKLMTLPMIPKILMIGIKYLELIMFNWPKDSSVVFETLFPSSMLNLRCGTHYLLIPMYHLTVFENHTKCLIAKFFPDEAFFVIFKHGAFKHTNDVDKQDFLFIFINPSINELSNFIPKFVFHQNFNFRFKFINFDTAIIRISSWTKQ